MFARIIAQTHRSAPTVGEKYGLGCIRIYSINKKKLQTGHAESYRDGERVQERAPPGAITIKGGHACGVVALLSDWTGIFSFILAEEGLALEVWGALVDQGEWEALVERVERVEH